MTIYEIATLSLASTSILIAAFALWYARKVGKSQVVLNNQLIEFNNILLEENEKKVKLKKHADIDIEITDRHLILTSVGQCTAYKVEMKIPQGNDLIISSELEEKHCPACDCEGQVSKHFYDHHDWAMYNLVTCKLCDGSGSLNGNDCPACDCEGQVSKHFYDQHDWSQY